MIMVDFVTDTTVQAKLFLVDPETCAVTSTSDLDYSKKQFVDEYNFGVPFCKWRGHQFILVDAVLEIEEDHETGVHIPYSKFELVAQNKGKLLFSVVGLNHAGGKISIEHNPTVEPYPVLFPKIVTWMKQCENRKLFKQFKVSSRPVTPSN